MLRRFNVWNRTQGLALATATLLVASPAFAHEAKQLTIGSVAPPLNIEHWLQNGDGKLAKVEKFEKGKVYLVEFWATWCGPCLVELPHIEHIWSDLRHDDRFRLVVVGREETAETVRTFRQEHEFSFPMADDPERVVYSLFAAEGIPLTMVVSPEGKIIYSKAGFYVSDMAELYAVLKGQLAALKY